MDCTKEIRLGRYVYFGLLRFEFSNLKFYKIEYVLINQDSGVKDNNFRVSKAQLLTNMGRFKNSIYLQSLLKPITLLRPSWNSLLHC